MSVMIVQPFRLSLLSDEKCLQHTHTYTYNRLTQVDKNYVNAELSITLAIYILFPLSWF